MSVAPIQKPAHEHAVMGQVLGEAVSVLRKAELDHLVIGGIASSALGRPRSTDDLDLLLTPDGARRALRVLADAGFTTDALDATWIYKAVKSGVTLDLIFKTRNAIYLDREMMEHSREAIARGVKVRVVGPEDLLIMKVTAYDEQSPRHWHDALALVTCPNFDWDYLEVRARRAQLRVLSLLLYALSLDYWIPERTVRALLQRAFAPW